MDVVEILRNLLHEREQVEQAILAIERLEATGTRRPARQSDRLAVAREQAVYPAAAENGARSRADDRVGRKRRKLFLVKTRLDVSPERSSAVALDLFERLFALIPDLAMVMSPEGHLQKVNSAWQETLGYTSDDLRGMSIRDLVHPDDLALPIMDRSPGTATRAFLNRCRCRDGSYKDIEWMVAPAADRSVMIATGKDITERKKAADLEEQDRQLSTIYESVADALFMLSVEDVDRYCFLTVNRTFLALTGLSESQVRGRYLHEVIPADSLPAVLGHYRRALTARTNVRWHEVSVYPAGTKRGEVSITPIFDSDSRCARIVGTVRDLTEI